MPSFFPSSHVSKSDTSSRQKRTSQYSFPSRVLVTTALGNDGQAQPQQQRAFMNTLKNKGMRSYVGFADEASFRMGASMSRMSYMTRVEASISFPVKA